MLITDHKTLGQIQEEFNQQFPGLKIHFFRKSHGKYKGSSDEDMLPNESLIGEIRHVHETKEFSINPKDSVAKIESMFHDIYGLNAQIYRRSKELWLQTSSTDDWTLEKQNLKGIHSTKSNLSLYDKA